MSTDAIIINRMRSAQVPPQVWDKSLDTEQFTALKDDFDNRGFELGQGVLKSYAVSGATSKVSPTRIVLACHLAAKSLILQRRQVPVYCTTFSELVDNAAGEAPYHSPLVTDQCLGRGYIVCPDIICGISAVPWQRWLSAQAFIQSHVSRGGGLILGLYDEQGYADDTWSTRFTPEMQMLLSLFEHRKVR